MRREYEELRTGNIHLLTRTQRHRIVGVATRFGRVREPGRKNIRVLLISEVTAAQTLRKHGF